MTGRTRLGLALSLAPLCALVAALFLADQFASVEARRDWWWAGLQLWAFPVPYRMLAALAPLLVLALPSAVYTRMAGAVARGARRVCACVVAAPGAAMVVLFPVLWLFRATLLGFGDSVFFATDVVPREAMSERGVLVVYDAIGVWWLHTMGYRWMHRLFGLDVVTVYNLLGLLSLWLFLWWAWCMGRRGVVLAGGAAMAALLCGNWAQVAMGPVEHYAQMMLCLAAFGILGVECLQGRAALWQPTLAYALGAFFHLGVAWLFPALVALWCWRWRAESRDGRWSALAAAVIPAALTGTLAYQSGFDLSFFAASNAGRGKLIPFLSERDVYSGALYQYSTFDPRHLFHILSEMLLMGWPGVLLLAGTAWAGRRGNAPPLATPALGFLLVFLGGTLAFNLLWNPDLGFWADQDLFSTVGLALCLLGAFVYTQRAPWWDDATRARVLGVALVGGLLWRLPVMLFHSVLAPNYAEPTVIKVVYPFLS